MNTSYVLNEVNKLVAYAKWDDEALAELMEGFAELEEPDLSPLPALVDKLHQQGASAKERVDTYLIDYFSNVSDEDVPILVYLAGELPERDYKDLKKGDSVYWVDPCEHLGNGWYTIIDIHADSEISICDDTIIVIRSEAGREAEVPPYELR